MSICRSLWNISTIRWISLKFCADVRVPRIINPTDSGDPLRFTFRWITITFGTYIHANNFGDLLTFYSAPSSGQKFTLKRLKLCKHFNTIVWRTTLLWDQRVSACVKRSERKEEKRKSSASQICFHFSDFVFLVTHRHLKCDMDLQVDTDLI